MRKPLSLILTAGLGILFFFVYLFLHWDTSLDNSFLILNQPDEVANYFFIRELALNGRITSPESLSQLALNQIHPRSMTVIFGNLVPIGFPGVTILYGTLLRFLTTVFGQQLFNWLAIAVTPAIAIGAAGFLYGLVKRIFSDRVALLSAGLFLISPPWWYYASRPFQHNTLFVFFLLGFFYFFSSWYFQASWSRRWLGALSDPPIALFLASIFFGLAIFVRPSELIWLSILLIFLLGIARKKIDWRGWLALGSGLALVTILFFSTQIAVYGAPFGSGYVKPTDSGEAGALWQGSRGLFWWQAVLLPFGFNPYYILQNAGAYFWVLWPWWSVAALIGLALLARDIFREAITMGHCEPAKRAWPSRRLRDCFASLAMTTYPQLFYLVGFLFIATYLLIFYGSWSFFDNLARVPSIASSHVRYFLPIYALSTPLAALFLDKLWSGRYPRKAAAVLTLLILLGNSLNAVYFAFDGLLAVKASIAKYHQWQKEIYSLVPAKGVVLTRYADKYLWPGRRVIAGWRRPEQLQAAANLVHRGFSVYLYDLVLSARDENTLKNELAELGLGLEKPILKLDNLELRPLILVKK